MTLTELKKTYNHWIDREIKAEKYFSTLKPNEIEKYLPEFNKITQNLSKMMKAYFKMTGKEMDDIQVFKGFAEVR